MFQDLYSWNICISTSPITPPFPGVYCRTLLHSLNSHISLMHKKEGGNWQLFSPLLSHQVSIPSSLRHKVWLYISVSLTKSLLETGNCLYKSILHDSTNYNAGLQILLHIFSWFNTLHTKFFDAEVYPNFTKICSFVLSNTILISKRPSSQNTCSFT